MAKKKALDLKALDELLSNIDKVYDKLLEVEGKLETLESRSQKMQIGKTLSVVVDTLGNVLSALVGIGKKKVEWKFLDQLANMVDRLLDITHKAKDIQPGLTGLQLLADLLDNTFRRIAMAVQDFTSRLKAGDILKLSAIFGALILLVTQLAKIKAVSGTFVTIGNALNTGFTALASAFSKLPSGDTISKVVTSIATALRAFKGLVSVQLDAKNLLKLGAAIAAAVAAFAVINKFSVQPGNIESFSVFVQKLSVMARALLRIPSIDNVVLGNIAKLSAILAAMGALFAIVARLTIKSGDEGKVIAFTTGITQIVEAFKNMATTIKAGLPSLNIADILNVLKVTAAMSAVLNSVLKAFKRTDTEKITAIAHFLIGFRTFFDAIIFINSEIAKLPKDKNLFAPLVGQFIGGLSLLLDEVAKLNSKISAGKLLKLTVLFPLFVGMTTLFGKVFDLLGLVRNFIPQPIRDAIFGLSGVLLAIPDTGIINKFAASIGGLVNVTKALGKLAGSLSLGDVVKANLLLNAIIMPLKSLTFALARSGIANEFSSVVNSISNIIIAVTKIKDLAIEARSVKLADVVRISAIFLGLGLLVRAMAAITVTKANKDSLLTLAEIMRAVSNLLDATRKAMADAKGASLSGIFNLLKIFLVFRLLIGALFGVIKNFSVDQVRAGADLFKGMAAIFQAIVELMTKFSTMKKLDSGAFKENIKFIKEIFKLITGLKIKNAEKNAPFVQALGNLMSGIVNLTKGQTENAKNFESIARDIRSGLEIVGSVKIGRNVARNLTPLLETLSKFVDVDFAGIAAAFKALESLSKIDGNAFADPKTMKQVGAGLRAFVNEIGDLKIDAARTKAVAELINSLSKLSGTTQNAAANAIARQRDGVIDTIKKGFFGAIGGKLADAMVAAFNKLNPTALLHGLLTSAVTFGKQIVSTFQNVYSQLKNIFDQINQLGQNLVSFGQNLLSGFGVGAIMNNSAFQAAAGFDALSSQLQTFGGLTDEQLVKAQDFANEIGIKYPLSANDAISAMVDLSKAGQSLPNIQNILPSAADLASIMDSHDIQAATKILIAAQATFSEFSDGVAASFDNSAAAADIIANTANLTTASIESLSEGLANVGPIAKQFGLSFVDVNAILGQFEDSNLRGAEAGTALKSLLTQLNTKPALDEFRRLGISITDSNGNFRDLDDIIKDLNKSFNETQTIRVSSLPGASAADKARLDAAQDTLRSATRNLLLWQNGLASGSDDATKAGEKIAEYNRQISQANAIVAELTGSQETANYITQEITRSQQENAASLREIFGSYGQVGGAILLANNGFSALEEEILGAGTAGETAAQLLDNFNGDILQLQGSVETLQTKAFLPLIRNVFRPLVKVLRFVIDAVLQVDSAFFDWTSTMIGLVAVGATFFGGLSIGIGTLISFGATVGTVLLTLLNFGAVIGAIVGGLTSLVVGLVAFVSIGTVVGGILLGITAVFKALQTIFQDNLGGATDSLQKFLDLVSSGGTAVLHFFRSIGEVIGAIFTPTTNTGLEQIGESISAFFENLANNQSIKKGIKLAQAVGDLLHVVAQGLTLDKRIQDRIDETQRNFNNAAQYIGSAFPQAIDAATDTARKRVLEDYEKLVDAFVGNSIVSHIFGTSVAKDIRDLLAKLLFYGDQIRSALGEVFGAFPQFFKDLGQFGFDVAFSDLKNNLSTAVSGLLRTVLTAVSDLFGVNFSDVIEQLDAGNLTDAIVLLIQRGLSGVKNVLLANRGAIKNVLTSIASFLFSPFKTLSFISKVFGLDSLTNIFDGLQNILEQIFGGIIDTIFNLLSGQDLGTAVENAFGPGIKPLVSFVEALVSIGQTLFSVVTNLFSGVETALDGGPAIGDILNGILTDVTSFLTSFNDQVLKPLVSGDFFGALHGIADMMGSTFFSDLLDDLESGDWGAVIADIATQVWGIIESGLKAVPDLITNLGVTLNSPLLVGIGADLRDGDWSSVVSTIANAIWGVIHDALISVPTLITNLGTDLNSPLLTSIGTDLQNGDWSSAITTIASAVWSVLESGLKAVPDLIVNIGTLLGSPLLERIGNDLKTADYADVITTIAEGIRDLIVSALNAVPQLLTDLGTTLNLSFLTDIGLSLEQSEAFQHFVDAVSNLLTLPIDTLASIIDSLEDVVGAVQKLAETDPARLGIIAAIIGGILLFFTGPAIVAGIAAVGTALAGLASTVLIPIAGVVAVLLLLKNGISAIADVISGKKNVFEGISDFFTGLASDALGLLGIQITPEEIADRITTFFNSVNGLIQIFLSNAVNQAKTAFQNIIDGVFGSIDDAAARADQSVFGQHTGFGDLFFELQQSVKDNNFRAIAANLAEAAEKGFDLEPFRRALRNNFTGVMDSFKKDLPNLLSFSQEDFGAVVSTLVNANALDDALALIPADQIGEFYQRLFAVDPKLLAGLDFTTIQTQLSQALASGIFDLSQVTDFVLKLPNLTDEQKTAIINSLTAQMATAPAGETPVEVPVNVTPKPTITAEEFAKLPSDVQNQLRNQYTILPPAQTTPVEVDVPITPNPVVPEDGSTEQIVADVQETAQQIVEGATGEGVTVPVTPEFALPTTPEDAQALADNLALVTLNLGTLQDTATLFAETAQPAIDQLNAMGVNLNTVQVNAGLVVTRLQVLLVNLGVYTIGSAVLLTANAIGWNLWSLTVAKALDTVISKLGAVKDEIYLVLEGLAKVGSAEIPPGGGGGGDGGAGGGGGGIQPDGGGAYGAATQVGELWKIIERRQPELYQENGNTYLLASGNGQIMPATPLPDFSSMGGRGLGGLPLGASNGGALTASGNSVIINDGDVTVNIDGANISDPNELADLAAQRVQAAKDQNYSSFRKRLRTNHR